MLYRRNTYVRLLAARPARIVFVKTSKLTRKHGASIFTSNMLTVIGIIHLFSGTYIVSPTLSRSTIATADQWSAPPFEGCATKQHILAIFCLSVLFLAFRNKPSDISSI